MSTAGRARSATRSALRARAFSSRSSARSGKPAASAGSRASASAEARRPPWRSRSPEARPVRAMPSPIEFYFDFSSPYGYIGSEKIDGLAAKYSREVTWRPIMLGVVFKATGGAPLPSIPLKWPYSVRDIARTAKFHGVEYRPPPVFPIATVSPCRAFYWMDGREPMRAKRLARALYRAYFVEGLDISKAESTVAVCERSGLRAEEVRAALADQ